MSCYYLARSSAFELPTLHLGQRRHFKECCRARSSHKQHL